MDNKFIKVLWKTERCSDEDCWCLMVVPVEPIIDEDGNVWDSIIDAGVISNGLAEHIVVTHNNSLNQTIGLEEYLQPQLQKYLNIPVHYVTMAQNNLTKPTPKITPAPTELKDVNKLSQAETNAMRYMKEYEEEYKNWFWEIMKTVGIPSDYLTNKK